MCRENSPTLPWAGLASRTQRPTIMADHDPTDWDPDCSRPNPKRVKGKQRLSAGTEVFATSLRSDRHGTPPGPTTRSLGFAFTAVSPFY